MMRAKEINEEVLYAEGTTVKVAKQAIRELKERADSNRRKRIRLCAHPDIDDKLHQMLIVHTKDTYVRPHKHLNKSESIHMIEGSLHLVIFDELGVITDAIPMGEYSSGRAFFHRMNEPLYHTLLISSDYVVFHETANGPFKSSENAFPPWAPEDVDEVEFMAKLANAVEEFECGPNTPEARDAHEGLTREPGKIA